MRTLRVAKKESIRDNSTVEIIDVVQKKRIVTPKKLQEQIKRAEAGRDKYQAIIDEKMALLSDIENEIDK